MVLGRENYDVEGRLRIGGVPFRPAVGSTAGRTHRCDSTAPIQQAASPCTYIHNSNLSEETEAETSNLSVQLKEQSLRSIKTRDHEQSPLRETDSSLEITLWCGLVACVAYAAPPTAGSHGRDAGRNPATNLPWYP